jgi:uroporphyrinogen decarboxylase
MMRFPDPNFERLRKTLYGEQADRVPLGEVLIDEGAKESFLGKPLNGLATDLEFSIQAGYDYIILGRRVAGFPPLWEAARLENYYEVQRKPGHGRSRGVLNDWNDFKSYPWMKPGDLDFRIFDEAEKLLPHGMKVIRYLGPIFQMVWMLMGFETFSYRLADDPSLIEAIFDKIFAVVHREYEDAIRRESIGAIWYLDDIGVKDRLMVSPAFLRKALFPRMRVFAEGCKKRGIPFLYHTDGNITCVFEDIVDMGVNALHPIEPLAMDIYEIKKKIGEKLCLIGNIDVDLLLRGTPEEVEEDTKKHLKELGPGGGYVLGSSNSIHRTIKAENYRAMLDTALKYGNYPIEIE